jgi:predicted dienelactone hydrolase
MTLVVGMMTHGESFIMTRLRNLLPSVAIIVLVFIWHNALLLAAPPALASGKPGPFAVETLSEDWHDSARERDVPVKIYFPKTGAGPFPVIIFSHGLGGSRDGYEYLGRQWASYGYVSVHVQHKGSDVDVWRGKANPAAALRDSLLDLRNATNRPLDVRFAIDRVEKINRDETPLRGRLDMARVGMAGHSFGALTTLAVIGEVFPGPRGVELALPDQRVKAAVAMSSPVIGDKKKLDQAFAKIKTPCLHMTGTIDDSPVGETKAKDRRLPFDHIGGADQYLLIFNGGDHMVFSGRGRLPGREKDPVFQKMIRVSTTAFWDAYLKDDNQAKAFLVETGFQQMLGKNGTFEKKMKTP